MASSKSTLSTKSYSEDRSNESATTCADNYVLKNSRMLPWESVVPNVSAVIDIIDDFTARGMKRVFGRVDSYHKFRTFNLDIWKDKYDGLYMRCWSRSNHVNSLSFEIKGIDLNNIPIECGKYKIVDVWIPNVVRDEYGNWVDSEC